MAQAIVSAQTVFKLKQGNPWNSISVTGYLKDSRIIMSYAHLYVDVKHPYLINEARRYVWATTAVINLRDGSVVLKDPSMGVAVRNALSDACRCLEAHDGEFKGGVEYRVTHEDANAKECEWESWIKTNVRINDKSIMRALCNATREWWP
jgi:alanine dehydrogenase